MQTPLSDEPAEDGAEDEDCTDLAELLDRSSVGAEDDETAELELGTDFAELDDATELEDGDLISLEDSGASPE